MRTLNLFGAAGVLMIGALACATNKPAAADQTRGEDPWVEILTPRSGEELGPYFTVEAVIHDNDSMPFACLYDLDGNVVAFGVVKRYLFLFGRPHIRFR